MSEDSNPSLDSGSAYLEHESLLRALDVTARERYEAARRNRVYQNERTYELRRKELGDIFACVDAELLLTEKKQQTEASGPRKLEEVTNTRSPLRPPKVQRSRAIVTRTETVPMLPCKGYTLPRGNLIIGERFHGLDFALEEDQRILLERMRGETMARLHDITGSSTGGHGHDPKQGGGESNVGECLGTAKK